MCKTYIEDIQIFGMNMPFISSSEAKNAYFMSCKAMNEIYIFSLHEMKLMAFHSKNLNCDRFFALNDVIQVHTLRHINDDVA